MSPRKSSSSHRTAPRVFTISPQSRSAPRILRGETRQTRSGPRSDAENGSEGPQRFQSRAAAMPSVSGAESSPTRPAFARTGIIRAGPRCATPQPESATCFALVFVRVETKGHVPGSRGQRRQSAIKENCAPEMVFLPKTQDQMFVLQNPRRHGRLDFTGEKRGLQVAAPERFQHLMPSQQVAVQFR